MTSLVSLWEYGLPRPHEWKMKRNEDLEKKSGIMDKSSTNMKEILTFPSWTSWFQQRLSWAHAVVVFVEKLQSCLYGFISDIGG